MKKECEIVATYKKMTVSLPQAVVLEPLPRTTTFYIDIRFNAIQQSRIHAIIQGVYQVWNAHYAAIDDGEQSQMEACAGRYSKFNLAPVWYEGKLANGYVAADLMLDGLTTMFAANGFGRASKAFIDYPFHIKEKNYNNWIKWFQSRNEFAFGGYKSSSNRPKRCD